MKAETTIDLSKVTDMEFDGIDHRDYPDYSDAYCSGALYDGEQMSGDMLDELNDQYSDFVYEKLWDHLH